MDRDQKHDQQQNPEPTVETPEKKPQTLQELVAGNALMDAFIGITTTPTATNAMSPSPMLSSTTDAPMEDNAEGGATRERNLIREQILPEAKEVDEILTSIEACSDMEVLVRGMQMDLNEMMREISDMNKPCLNHDTATTNQALTEEVARQVVESKTVVDAPHVNGGVAVSATGGNATTVAVGSGHANGHNMSNGTTGAETVMIPTVTNPKKGPKMYLAARLARIKSLLYNKQTTSSYSPLFFLNLSQQQKTNASALLHSLLLDSERKLIMIRLVEFLNELPFETRKDVSAIFNYFLVCGCALEDSVEQTSFGSGGGGVASSSSSSVTVSYTKAMLSFVEYVDEYYTQFMKLIVEGHYVAGTIKASHGEVSHDTTNRTTPTNPSPPLTLPTPTSIKTVDVALHCGTMLRSTLRHPRLYANLTKPQHVPIYVYPFLDHFVNQPNFEVASDALETLRLILHPDMNAIASPSFTIASTDLVQNREVLESMMESTAAAFLEREYESIFVQRFNVQLLNAEYANYITRRVSLQILSAVLLTRSNYNVMIRYVSDWSNLKTIMMLLRDSSAHITLEAFHVFKIFVANPNKPVEIVRILADNKVKLVKYLSGLHREKELNDEQFRDEKALVISTLENIEYINMEGS